MNRENDSNIKIEQDMDSTLNAALKMLSETQPPTVMLSRIHRSLEAAAATSVLTRRDWWFWIPAGGAAVAVVLLMLFLSIHFTREKQGLSPEMTKMTVGPALPDRVVTSSASVPAVPVERKESISNHGQNFRRRDHTQYRHAANLFNYPLTRQEKLLVRFAQTAKPADLQALNPEYQAKIEAQQEAEFAAYVNSDSDGKNQGSTAKQSEINQFTEE